MINHTNIPAPLWRRLMAMVYDSLVLLAVSMAYGALATGVLVLLYGQGEHDYRPMSEGYGFLLGWIFCLLLFHLFFWRRDGQTLGMKAWRIKIVDRNGGSISVTQGCLRFFTAILSLLMFGIGYLWGLFNPERACWHDLASSSRTILLPTSQSNK